MTIGSQSQDIRFIKQDPGKLQKSGALLITNPVYVTINAIPLALLAGAIIVRRRREKLTSNVGLTRQRLAGRLARKRLAKARAFATTDKTHQFHAELSAAIVSYIADKLNVSPHGLTSDQISELLTQSSVDPALIAELVGLLRQCDFARFASTDVSVDRMAAALKSAEGLMTRMEGIKLA